MKSYLRITLCGLICFCGKGFAEESEITVDSVVQQTQDFYRTRSGGSQDATFSAVGKSMIAWGLGLSAAIAILASAIHQSNSDSSSSSSN